MKCLSHPPGRKHNARTQYSPPPLPFSPLPLTLSLPRCRRSCSYTSQWFWKCRRQRRRRYFSTSVSKQRPSAAAPPRLRGSCRSVRSAGVEPIQRSASKKTATGRYRGRSNRTTEATAAPILANVNVDNQCNYAMLLKAPLHFVLCLCAVHGIRGKYLFHFQAARCQYGHGRGTEAYSLGTGRS